jgi:hypothetical protein
MRKRLTMALVAGGLLAAMLPGMAAAQTEGEGTSTYAPHYTCEAGQGSPLSLPPCEFDEEAGLLSVTFLHPGITTGALEGVQLFDGVAVVDLAEGSYSGTASMFWSGTVEGCGAGTFYAEGEYAATTGPDGTDTFSVNTYTIVPGGSLPITGTIDGDGTEVLNADRSRTLSITATYSCDEEVTPEE